MRDERDEKENGLTRRREGAKNFMEKLLDGVAVEGMIGKNAMVSREAAKARRERLKHGWFICESVVNAVLGFGV